MANAGFGIKMKRLNSKRLRARNRREAVTELVQMDADIKQEADEVSLAWELDDNDNIDSIYEEWRYRLNEDLHDDDYNYDADDYSHIIIYEEKQKNTTFL